jgi:hypothetical protein
MYKLVTFSGYDTSGPHIFPIEPDLDRTIGHIKMARPLPPEIEQYIRTAKPIPGKTQLLIDAMGAGEFYGSKQRYVTTGRTTDTRRFRSTPIRSSTTSIRIPLERTVRRSL